jgi:hypothetical protein
MLKKNLDILRRRFPQVLQRILAVGEQKSSLLCYDDSSKLLAIKPKGEFPIYGTRSKERLIEDWFGALRLKNESLYSLSGFGDGSHVRYFLKNTSGGIFILVMEVDAAILKETFSRHDCSDILSHERFLLGTGLINEDFFKDMQEAVMQKLSDINSLIFSPLHCLDEGYYDKARNEMLRQYLVLRPLMEVNLRTGTNLQENTLENLPHMASAPDIGSLEGMFKDTPFILVGAGPSLDDSIDFLREVQNRTILVCSNSSFRKLINSGIRPNLVVTADPMPPTLAGFQNVDLKDVPLACPFSAYPEIVRRFSGRIISWVTFSPLIEVLKESQGLKAGTPIMEQGTVSGCVLDISRLLGCEKVLLVGQDMCVRADGKYYTDDSAYADSGSHFVDKIEGHRLPGNTVDEVVVEGRLFVYLKTFEKFIKENPTIKYRNLAKTGVKVEGAPFISYDEAIQWIWDDKSDISFDKEVQKLLSSQVPCPSLADIYYRTKKYTESLLEQTLSLAIKTELLPEKLQGSNYLNNKALTSLLTEANKVNRLVDSDPKMWNLLLDGKTKSELARYKRIIRDIDKGNKNWVTIQKNKEFFWALAEGCHWLLNLLDEKIFAPQKNTTVIHK